mmetsp:Transcript_31953/g.41065  ORF Transcript_31953/g.41065 Transcript_31953/m.41065 type:complete len:376 (-) Transcript_31953:110-1237(-)
MNLFLVLLGGSLVDVTIASYNSLDLLVSARAWKGEMAWAGGGMLDANYQLNTTGYEFYTKTWTPSNFAAFVDAPNEQGSLLVDLDASMCCWQFVQTMLADNNLNNWSLEVLHANENVALKRSHDIDSWLMEFNVPALTPVSPYSTSFHAALAYLGNTVAMLGAGETTSNQWYDATNQQFVGDSCPPTGAIVSFGITSHFLVSSGPPPSSTEFDPYSCRFVHLFHGGCADGIDCWGDEHVDYCNTPELDTPCNSTHVYESDLLYLANSTMQWNASTDEIDWLVPRSGDEGLTNAEAIQSWVYIAIINEPGSIYLDPEYYSARYLLRQLNSAGAVSDDALTAVGISPEQLQEDPASADVETSINLLGSYFLEQLGSY